MPDAHAGDVGDRIERSRRSDARLNTEIARPWTVLGDRRTGCEDGNERHDPDTDIRVHVHGQCLAVNL
jgi:hypothetical protein